MTESASQRQYRAPCPGCGAPVLFQSAQSTHAVCAYCRSAVVRQGETLSRIGKMAELFDDHSPLQLMASGRIRLEGRDERFTLVGRLQYKSPTGVWTEWNALLDDGRVASLSEDNGAYVFTQARQVQRELPAAGQWRVGATVTLNGQAYSVAFADQIQLLAAEGEVPKLPALGQPFSLVELRSADGEVVSIDYGSTPAAVSAGRAVRLEDLQLSGLKDESVKEEKGRQFNCPHCGAPVEITLESTKSLTCRSCNSLIDVSQGIGGELRHALQDEPVRPLIALGSQGQLQGVSWQVVGFQHRVGREPGDDELFGWSEYLLYNRQRGFSFLVDSEEGWSLVKPTTGAPQMAASGRSATYLGVSYALKYAYEAETTYVSGEFYWPVERGQKTSNRDFASSRGVLSMEQTPSEVTWSAGDRLEAATVARAFQAEGKADLFQRQDALPAGTFNGPGSRTVVVLVVLLVLVVIMLSQCSQCDPRVEYCPPASGRSTAGSWGGFSTGGGHK